jgi:small-conductance mechanosensitive channel
MKTRSALDTWMRQRREPWGWLRVAAVGAVLLGCASTESARKEPTPRDDFREYRQLVVQAMSQVDTTLRALDEISVEANRDPRPGYAAFAKAVQRLEVDSIRMRARTQAMRARGDAYFEHWEAYLAGVNNEQVRKLAEEHRAELKQSFEQAQQAAQEVREVFRPFLSDLQKIRAVLEAESNLARIDAEKSLILAAGDKGRQVEQGLDRLLAEMNSMTALLRPPGAAPKR